MVPPTRVQVLVGCVAVLLVLAAVGVRMQRSPGGADAANGRGARVAFSRPASRALLTVDVAGAVRRPGVYRLPEGARVLDALRRAGGTRPRAQLGSLNRAAPLVDGQQVLVPAVARGGCGPVGTAGAGGAAAGGAAASGVGAPVGPVPLNSADVAALDTLTGIGPVTAAAIVQERSQNGPFTSIDDLDRVPGIGAATIEQIRGSVTL